MRRILSVLLAAIMLVSSFALTAAAEEPAKEPQIIYLKFDDIRQMANIREAYYRMTDYLEEKDLIAGYGVICVSLEDDGSVNMQEHYQAIRDFAASGRVEIWCHGYYHDSTHQIEEFETDKYDDQYKFLTDCANLLKEHCGVTVHTFGAPFNWATQTTNDVLCDIDQFVAYYIPPVTTFKDPDFLALTNFGDLEYELNKVSYDKFVEKYEAGNKDKDHLVLQGHVAGWDEESWAEFDKIIDFLKEQGCVFRNPYERYCELNSVACVTPEQGKYNKSAGDRSDLVLDLNLNTNTVTGVSADGKALDYTVDGDKLTIPTAALDTVEKGDKQIVISFDKSEDAVVELKVVDPSSEPITVELDGNLLSFDVEPQIINDRTMVPFRAIFEALGAVVDWDPNTSTAMGRLDDISIQLPIDHSMALVNGTSVELDSPATLVNDRTLVPLRFISENFGATVTWDGDIRRVSIISGPRRHEIPEGDYKGNGLVPVAVKSVLNSYKDELFTIDGAIVADDRWPAEGKYEWISYEFEYPVTVGSVATAWFKGNERISHYEVQVSLDGFNFTTVFDGDTSGATTELEKITFDPVDAMYVRIVCKGNNSSASTWWNSLTEVEVYAAE